MEINDANSKLSQGHMTPESNVPINASGHKDQLTRQYGILGLASMAVNVNNAWVVLGSSLSIAFCWNSSQATVFFQVATK